MKTDAKKVAVVLAGCGVYDGAEIQEAVLTLLALSRRGVAVSCFAPDIPQTQVINHRTGQEMAESRNVLVEAARITRGAIADLATFSADAVDGLVFPGGFGVAKNLSSFAFAGADCTVEPGVAAALSAMAAAGKPIAALCIAPALLARVLGGGRITIGQHSQTAAALEKLGATHIPAQQTEIVVDKARKLVTSPCYMLEATVAEIAESADKAIAALLELMEA